MSCAKSVKWLKKKRAKFLAKMSGSVADSQVRSLAIDETDPNKCSPSRYLLLANFGLTNAVSRGDIVKLLANDKLTDVILPFGRPYSIAVFETEDQAVEGFLRVADQKNYSGGDVCPFFLSSLPHLDHVDVEYGSTFPDGINIVANFLTEEEEKMLVTFVDGLQKSKPVDSLLKQRKAWHFGFTFDYSMNQISFSDSNQPLPSFCSEFLFERLLKNKLISELPNQMTINEYESGDGIPFHIESSSFADEIVSISLVSPIVMEMRLSSYDKTRPHISLLLENRSVLVLSGEARRLWEHGIPGRKYEVAVETNGGLPVHKFTLPNGKDEAVMEKLLIPSNGLRFATLNRRRRISLTLRKVVQNLPEQNKIPSRAPLLNSDVTDMSLQLEQSYVREVYETVAPEFSSTRHTPWPKVASFMRSLPEGSLVADVGCGNGRYFGVNTGVFICGSDSCENLLKLASKVTPRASVLIGDCCCLPFRSDTFDAAICIAVIHHMASEARRRQAVDEIIRILRPNGGRALIYVWAVEQSDELTGQASTYTANCKAKNGHEKDENVVSVNGVAIPIHQPRTPFSATRPDCFVPWKKNSLRFYHVFQRAELEDLFSDWKDKITFSNRYFDEGNWCVEFVKN